MTEENRIQLLVALHTYRSQQTEENVDAYCPGTRLERETGLDAATVERLMSGLVRDGLATANPLTLEQEERWYRITFNGARHISAGMGFPPVTNISEKQRAAIESRIDALSTTIKALPPAEKFRLAADLLDGGQKTMAVGVALAALEALMGPRG